MTSIQDTRDDVGAGGAATYGNLRETVFGSEVQVGIALLLVVRVAQVIGVVAYDALHQRQIVE